MRQGRGTAANGVVFPVRTEAVWGGSGPGMDTIRAISRTSDPTGNVYRPVHYLAGACAAMLMVEAMETAATNGGQVTGERIRDGFYARENWVPNGFQGVCTPSTFTAADHRGTMRRALSCCVTGNTGQGSLQELATAGTMASTGCRHRPATSGGLARLVTADPGATTRTRGYLRVALRSEEHRGVYNEVILAAGRDGTDDRTARLRTVIH